MSSRRFVAELKPDPDLRRVVILAACTSLLIGIALVIRLPIPAWARFGLAVLWISASLWDIGRISRGNQRVRFIRLTVGQAAVVDRQGREEPVQIMSGSVVLPRLAWLRLKWRDGLIGGELIRGDPAGHQHWRRLQILWRQGPGTFGGRGLADTISTRKPGSHS